MKNSFFTFFLGTYFFAWTTSPFFFFPFFAGTTDFSSFFLSAALSLPLLLPPDFLDFVGVSSPLADASLSDFLSKLLSGLTSDLFSEASDTSYGFAVMSDRDLEPSGVSGAG